MMITDHWSGLCGEKHGGTWGAHLGAGFGTKVPDDQDNDDDVDYDADDAGDDFGWRWWQWQWHQQL